MSDKPVKVCPKCKARKVEKLISHTSFQLKGGGWYSDLYASQKPGASPPAAESAGEKSSASASESSAAAASTDSSTAPTTPTGAKNKGKKGAAKAAA